MKARMLCGMALLIGVGSLGCLGAGGGGDSGFSATGTDDDGRRYSMSASLYCDPDADLFDDVFYFVAAVEPHPDEVVAVLNLGNQRVDLDYDAPSDTWGATEWADDLGTDCDDVPELSASYAAYADGEEVAAGSVSAEIY